MLLGLDLLPALVVPPLHAVGAARALLRPFRVVGACCRWLLLAPLFVRLLIVGGLGRRGRLLVRHVLRRVRRLLPRLGPLSLVSLGWWVLGRARWLLWLVLQLRAWC